MTRLSEIIADAGGPAFGAAASFKGEAVYLPGHVQVIDNVVEWCDDGITMGRVREGRVEEGCLRRFARLAAAPPKAFSDFAYCCGPLYLGLDGLPVAKLDDLPSRSDVREPRRVWYQEPLEGWRAWARYVRTVLVLSHELKSGDRIVPDFRLSRLGLDLGPKDPTFDANTPLLERRWNGALYVSALGWTVFDRLWPWRLVRELDDCQSAIQQWESLAADVNERLLEVAGFTARLRGTPRNPRIELELPFDRYLGGTVGSAMPVIFGQLLATITTGERRMHVCHECRLPYEVQRRRKYGRCPECNRKARSASVQKSKLRAKERAQEAAAG